jgi:multiple sugar transport system ATP-binding protein
MGAALSADRRRPRRRASPNADAGEEFKAQMASGSAVALSFSGVTKAYGAVRALDGLDLEVPEGRFFVLFGPSAVGKTTTLRAVAGLVRPDSGSIRIVERDVTSAPIKGRGVSMVFQSFALYPHLTVFKNLAYPLIEDGVSSADVARRVRETAQMLKLEHRLGQKPATLSGGEQQRVALGRSLIHRPKLLLLDEPLTNLDAKLRHDMRAELKRLHRQFGMTVVYATPDELEALSMGEEIAVLRAGRAVQQGSPDDLYERPVDRYVASKIGSPHMNIFDVKVGGDGASLETPYGRLSPARLPGRLAAGEPLSLGVRPSDIRLAGGAPPSSEATVQQLEPLGDVTVVSLVSNNQPLRMVLPEAQAVRIKEGDKLPIIIDPAKIYLFRGHDGSAIGRS